MEKDDRMAPEHKEVVKGGVDFDRSEPRALLIAAFGIASVLGLTATVLGVQAYFDHLHEQEMYQKVMVPVSQDLQNLHNQEDQELNTYKYIDRGKGIVQIPIARAMQLMEEEAAEGKLHYFRKATPVKVPNAAAATPTGAPAAGANQAAPAGAAPQANAPAATPQAAAAPGKSGNGSASSSSSGKKL